MLLKSWGLRVSPGTCVWLNLCILLLNSVFLLLAQCWWPLTPPLGLEAWTVPHGLMDRQLWCQTEDWDSDVVTGMWDTFIALPFPTRNLLHHIGHSSLNSVEWEWGADDLESQLILVSKKQDVTTLQRPLLWCTSRAPWAWPVRQRGSVRTLCLDRPPSLRRLHAVEPPLRTPGLQPPLRPHPLLPLSRRSARRPTARGRSAGCAASTGRPSPRRRCGGSPTSGRWPCGSSSTRSTCAPWRSCSASRRRAPGAVPPPVEPHAADAPEPPSRRARMRWGGWAQNSYTAD